MWTLEILIGHELNMSSHYPNVGILVDAVVGHERFSFMDDYSGYN